MLRRDFLKYSGTMAAAAALLGPARAAMGPTDKFDLVIKGGEVIDPSQSLRARRDIGIRFGAIESLDAEIPAARAQKLIDASGKLVTPGLIDLHTHVYPYGSAIGIPADELIAQQGTTTCVSAGDAGANNFAGFRRHIAAARETQLPLVIHSRSADADMAAILTEETGKGAFPFILHCFSAGPELARTGVELGGYISFSGILTFPKSEELREIAITDHFAMIDAIARGDSQRLAEIIRRHIGRPKDFYLQTTYVQEAL